MKRAYFYLFTILFLMGCTEQKSFEKEIDEYNYIIGTQTVGAKYKFSDETNLVETAKAIREMGSNMLKMSMSPRYFWENYDIPYDSSITSLTLLAQEKSMKEVLEMDFKYYQIWIYEFSQYTTEPQGEKKDENQIKFIDGYEEHYKEQSYREIYSLACHLLENYSGTGKVFMLGNWEGDWHLRWDYDASKPANPETIQGMISWFNTRQQAIDDAKRDTPHQDIEMYHYIEMNLSNLAVEGKTCVTNDVLPHINPDFVSFSAYTATNPPQTEQEMDSMLTTHLNYIESKILPKPTIKGKRLFVGEYGWHEGMYSPETINQRAKWVIKTGLKWGCPYILFWEMYNNELDENGINRGFWLINNDNEKTPLYFTHKRFYEESRTYLEEYANTHGNMPSEDEFREAALKFEALK